MSGDHGPAAGHPLDDHPAERLGPGAGVDHHIQGPQGRGRVGVESDEADAAVQAQRPGAVAQLRGRPLRADRAIDRPAHEIEPAWPVGRDPGGGLQERFDNFVPYLLKYGDAFVETLVENLVSFENGFVVLEDIG